MPIASGTQVGRTDARGGTEHLDGRQAWLYTAANALFLLYLIWAAPFLIARIIERRFWVVIPLAIVLICVGARLIAWAPRVRIWRAAALAFALYVLWGVCAEVTPVFDFMSFFSASSDLATRNSLAAALTSKSPTTIAWYGAAFRLLGAGYVPMYVAAAILWAVQIPLLYAALGSLGLQDATAKTAALIYGFSPSVVFYAPLITSESVFNCLIMVCLFIVSRSYRHTEPWLVAALGAATGLLFITRMNGLAFLIAFLVVIQRSERIPRSAWRRRLILVTAFSLVVLLNALATSRYTGHFSLMPSRWGAYLFMTGTNRASHGAYSAADRVLAGFAGEARLNHADASRNAWRIGIERIADDPLGFAAFALTDKLDRLWATDISSVNVPTDRSPRRQAMEQAGIIAVAYRLTDGFWLSLNLTAAFALLWHLPWPGRRVDPLPYQLTCVVVLPMLLWSLMHIFIEVQQRYHIPYMPLLCTLSALGLQTLRNFARHAGSHECDWCTRFRRAIVRDAVSAKNVSSPKLRAFGDHADRSIVSNKVP